MLRNDRKIRRIDMTSGIRALSRTLAAAAVLSGLVSGWMRAEAPVSMAAPAVRTLSLEEALRIADDQNRDIRKAKEYRQKVLGKYVEEKAGALPQVLVNSSFSKDSDESQKAMGGGKFPMPVSRTSFGTEVGVKQAVFTWGQVGAAIRAAKAGMADAEEQLRIYRQAVARDVTTAFYDVVLAHELLSIATENLSQKQRHLEEARKKNDAGVATDYDVLAADVAVQNARPEVIRTENAIRLARERLRFLLGLEGQEVDVAGNLDVDPQLAQSFEVALATARNARPELAEIAQHEAMYGELIRIYGAGDKPRLDFQSGIGYRHAVVGDGRAGGLAWSAGLYLTFPAWDGGRTKGRLIQARSDLETVRLEKSRLADAIVLQVRDAVNSVEEAVGIVHALTGTVTQANRLLQMADQGFANGVMTRLEVQDAQLNLMSARANLSKARRDYLVARCTLEWATGSLKLP